MPVFPRIASLFLAVAFLFPPLTAEAKATRLYEKWLIRTEENMLEWDYAGLEQAALTEDGLQFDVQGKAAIFRPVPEGFSDHVDALRIHMTPGNLDAVTLLLLTLDREGAIAKRFSLGLSLREGTDSAYVPLSPYRRDIGGADVIALSFEGEATGVTFGGIRFLRFSRTEKLGNAVRGFFTFEPFNPHTINILLGPAITTDPELIGGLDWQTHATSINAYLIVGLSLFGIALLFWRWRRGSPVFRHFFLAVFLVWLLSDLRMGAEFLWNVARDHASFVASAPEERTFRDRGRFYDFAAFVAPLVADRAQYEVFFPSSWPYVGSLRYATYPALPNPGAPVSDTWIVYDRPDITVGADQRLLRNGEAFTLPGVVLGRFDGTSFVFRES